MNHALLRLALLLAVGCPAHAASTRVDPPRAPAPPPVRTTLERMFGGDSLLLVSVEQPCAALELAQDSRAFALVARAPEWRAMLAERGMRQARTALRFLAGALRRSETEALRALLGREFAFALRAGAGMEPDFLLAVRAESEALAEQIAELVFQLALLAASAEHPIHEQDAVRSVDGRHFLARRGDVLLASNARAWIDDALRAPPSAPLPTPPARAMRVRASLDLAQLRAAGALTRQATHYDDALAPLLFDGALRAFHAAPRLEVELALDGAGLRAHAEIDAQRAADADAWFFPAGDNVITPPADAALWLRVRRDYHAFYTRRFELLQPELEGKIREFDNVTALFIGGRSFGDELLPALGDDALLVVAPPEFPDLVQPPLIRYPTVALITPIDAHQVKATEVLIAFQTVIGVVNADRAQNGLAPLLLATEDVDGVTLASARFLAPDDPNQPAAVRYNAQPAVAVAGGHLIVASSRTQARALIAHLARGAGADRGARAAGSARSELVLDLPRAAALLALNRTPLIAQRVLEHGVSEPEAARFIDLASAVLETFGSMRLALDRTEGRLRLQASVVPAAPAAPAPRAGGAR